MSACCLVISFVGYLVEDLSGFRNGVQHDCGYLDVRWKRWSIVSIYYWRKLLRRGAQRFFNFPRWNSSTIGCLMVSASNGNVCMICSGEEIVESAERLVLFGFEMIRSQAGENTYSPLG